MNVQYLSAGLGERVNLKAVRDCYAKKGCACACACVRACVCLFLPICIRRCEGCVCVCSDAYLYTATALFEITLSLHCRRCFQHTHTHTRLLGNVCRSDLQIHLLPEWRAAFTCLCVFLGNGVNEGTTTKKTNTHMPNHQDLHRTLGDECECERHKKDARWLFLLSLLFGAVYPFFAKCHQQVILGAR